MSSPILELNPKAHSHVQAEVLWIAASVGELALGQTIPLANLSLMYCRALGMLALSWEVQKGDHTPWFAALITEASCLFS